MVFLGPNSIASVYGPSGYGIIRRRCPLPLQLPLATSTPTPNPNPYPYHYPCILTTSTTSSSPPIQIHLSEAAWVDTLSWLCHAGASMRSLATRTHSKPAPELFGVYAFRASFGGACGAWWALKKKKKLHVYASV